MSTRQRSQPDPGAGPARPGPRIVVGVDGSPAAAAALRWAAEYARISGGTIQAVIAWHYPTAYGYPMPVSPMYDPEGSAAMTVAKAVTELQLPPESVQTRVVAGHPANVLVAAAEEADLLVVGSRGHGTVTGAVLGSVSAHCVHHAGCPVVVVRGRRDGSRDG